jgi:MoaA/NifB/PqqE/SkfB family radical SAM enzyme
MSNLNNYLKIISRPFEATKMLYKHRRTIRYMLSKDWYKRAYNFAFVTYFIRGEDCGKGCIDPFWWINPDVVPAFWDIELEVTTACPLHCRHCEHTYFPAEYRNQNLSFDQFKMIIDSIPRLKWINLTGEGSPFMNKDFMAMLRYAKSKDLYVDFSHDFYTYNENIGRSLIEMGIERIYFSIDGCTKATYENVRQGSNFTRVIKNVTDFIQLKKEMNSPLPEICFRYAFFKDNWKEVPMLPTLIASLGDSKDLGDDPSINIVGLLEFEQTKGLEVELPKKYIEATNQRAKALGLTVYWSHVTHDEARKPPCHYCVFWTEPYIMITGHVVPDCAVLMSNRRLFLEANSFGNVNQKPITDLWEMSKYRKFIETIRNPKAPVPSVCLGCRVFETQFRAKKFGVWEIDKE